VMRLSQAGGIAVGVAIGVAIGAAIDSMTRVGRLAQISTQQQPNRRTRL
jgi:hypothetical protein